MPTDYMICLNSVCPRAQTCLRHLYSMRYPAGQSYVIAFNPLLYPKENEDCVRYRPERKIRMAWGIKNLIRNLPHERAQRIKSDMLARFGRSRYYRFFREELPLTPDEQTDVHAIFRKNGVETAPEYARYSEETDW